MLKKTVAAVLSMAVVTGTMNLQQTNTYTVDRSKPWLLSTNRQAYSSSVNGEDVASFATDVRYVRVQGILMGCGSGHSVREILVSNDGQT